MDKINSNYNNMQYKNLIIKTVIALIGVSFVGFGIAFNSAAMLGNDAVAILYDGFRNISGLPLSKLGMVTNLVNYSLIAIVFLLSRKYINIGTFIYTIPMGTFVGVGSKIYSLIKFSDSLIWRILGSFCGCSMLFLGLGIFIAADIGFDPFTGMSMILKDKIKSQYKTAKVICDVTSLAIGFLLGGKAGAVTFIAAFIGGPIIQKASEFFKRLIRIHIKINKPNI